MVKLPKRSKTNKCLVLLNSDPQNYSLVTTVKLSLPSN